jgi:hypothetical protein
MHQNPGGNDTLTNLRKRLESDSGDSLLLASNLKDNPICSVSFDATVPCILVVWKGYATSTQLRFIHESILHLVKEFHVSKVLGDDTALTTIHSDDAKWIVEDWMPRAMAAGLKIVASITPEWQFGKLSVQHILSRAPQGFVSRSFNDGSKAWTWLRKVGTGPAPSVSAPNR